MRPTDKQAALFTIEPNELIRVVRDSHRHSSLDDPLAFYARVVMTYLERFSVGDELEDEQLIEAVGSVIGMDNARRAVHYLTTTGHLIEVGP